jgi:Gluconate 2-dehydrogenase subunit 3
MDRRTSLRWILAAGAAGAAGALAPAVDGARESTQQGAADSVRVEGHGSVNYGTMTRPGYGTDPDLAKSYHPGDIWPLTLNPAQRRLAAVLSDLIIPADGHSPAASAAGLADFIDEWVSAPYPDCQRDRRTVLEGFAWLDAEGRRRFGRDFVDLEPAQQTRVCDEICRVTGALGTQGAAESFFARYRDLTAGGFYSSPLGRTDLGYVGNLPRAHFVGPPAALLEKLGLPEELPSVRDVT